MKKDGEYYAYEAMNILMRPNVKGAIEEIALRCGWTQDASALLVQKYKLYDYQDSCSAKDNKTFFYGKSRIINFVQTRIQMQETQNEAQNISDEKSIQEESKEVYEFINDEFLDDLKR